MSAHGFIADPRPAHCTNAHGPALPPLPKHLLENVLFPHELLPLTVGLGDHDVQHILPIVGDVTDEEYQVLQQLNDKP